MRNNLKTALERNTPEGPKKDAYLLAMSGIIFINMWTIRAIKDKENTQV